MVVSRATQKQTKTRTSIQKHVSLQFVASAPKDSAKAVRGGAVGARRSIVARGLFDSVTSAIQGDPAQKTKQRFQARVDKINSMESEMQVCPAPTHDLASKAFLRQRSSP